MGLVADDAERLSAELERAAAGLPVEGAEPGAPGAPPSPAQIQWQGLTPFGVRVLADVVFPAWEVQPAEQAPIAEALAECLAKTFPGGISEDYHCYVKLAAACGAVAASRAAQPGGLPPLFRRRRPESTPAPTRDPMTLRSLTPDA